MLRAEYSKYQLDFKFQAKTSRSSMSAKNTYFIKVWDDSNPDVCGIGECALFEGLSAEDTPEYESVLKAVCQNIATLQDTVEGYSSIQFGLETAMCDLENGGQRIIFPSKWSDGETEIQINGLIWMGDKHLMFERIKEKIEKGFRCLKLKIGGIDFQEELSLIEFIRKNFSPDELELRLDANGAFSPQNALQIISELAKYHIHSLEQPIKAKQVVEMANICKKTEIPIALDEELIGWWNRGEQESLLDEIQPQYIILKPSLCGGFSLANKWIEIASKKQIGWWATSALESNIGLNAIAQWVSQKNVKMPQGLGTGNLYYNNIESPLLQVRDVLKCDNSKEWKIPTIKWQR